MLTGECFPNQNAEVLVVCPKIDGSAQHESTITNFVAKVKHYKATVQTASGATCVYDSNMKAHLLTIPSTYVPASGIFDITGTGTEIMPFHVRLQVNTADGRLALLATPSDVTTALSVYDPPTKAELDSVAAALNDITVTDIFNSAAEGSVTFIQAFRQMYSVLCGAYTVSGSNVNYKALNGTTTRVSSTISTFGRTVNSRDGN